jgi:predicted glycosyltransferase
MKIIVDINHPAHVHLFKYVIAELRNHGHNVIITASQKDISYKLLDAYGFDYIKMGTYGDSLAKKLINFPILDCRMVKAVLQHQPDILTGVASSRIAHAGFLCRKKTFVLDDTEHSTGEIALYKPFATNILTPSAFTSDLGRKQIRYEGFHQLAYLHPNYFKPDASILDYLKVGEGEKFVIMRFVSWRASHDIGHKGLSIEMKRKSVQELSKYAKIFITSEGELPQDLGPYRITIPPEKIHHALYYAAMYFGDGGTMASESAVLGTPAINIATSASLIGVFADIERYGLMYVIPDEEKALEKGLELLQRSDLRYEMKVKREKLISEKIDVTKFIVWLVENHPASVKIMKETPDYQKKFK